jgi:hypothetical protein
VFNQFLRCNMKMLLGDFNAKVQLGDQELATARNA